MHHEMISAIITTCKREPAIVRRAVMSILAQTYPHMELIVVDDSPSDYSERQNVADMIEEIRRNARMEIRYIQHPVCKGACAARNTGWKNANGSIIGYLDDDDEWLPRKAEKMIEGFTSPKIALVYCNHFTCNVTTGTIEKSPHKQHSGYVYDQLIHLNFVGSTSFPLIRKEALRSIGGFDIKMQSSQDLDVWLRLAKHYPFAFTDDYLAKYYTCGSNQISGDPLKRISGLSRIIAKNKAYIDKHPTAFWYRNVKIIPQYVRAGDFTAAFAAWRRCVRRCPLKLIGNTEYLGYLILKYIRRK